MLYGSFCCVCVFVYVCFFLFDVIVWFVCGFLCDGVCVFVWVIVFMCVVFSFV